MGGIKRRDFLKYGLGSFAAVVVGSNMPWITDNKAYAATKVQTLNFHITDAKKQMGTYNVSQLPQDSAVCYFWIYKVDGIDADCPGPTIFTTEGDTIGINITNQLDEPHAFFVPGMFNSGPIAPGQTVHKFFTAGKGGTYLYFDNLNAPVNRVMGLHGAFIVMPKAPEPGTRAGGLPHRFTPYSEPTPGVQKLFDDFGSAPWFPGLAWEEASPSTNTQPFRTYIWVLHQASPNLFAEVGDFTPGLEYPATQFVNRFLHDPFVATKPTTNAIPQYFTISGQSGHFSHNTPYICPNQRVGEPAVIRILNAGLWSHSMHIHANHQYICWVNGVVQENPIWVDVFNVYPMTIVDYVCPYMRPPSIPNVRGIGRADLGLPAGISGGRTWPPNEELNSYFPGPAPVGATPFQVGGSVTDGAGNSLGVQLSPLTYPMHDHSEPSQTSQGGNYNMGLISGINFIGDRNGAGPNGVGVINFPNQPLFHGPGPGSSFGVNGAYPAAVPPPWFTPE
jgi:hypothetical protein